MNDKDFQHATPQDPPIDNRFGEELSFLLKSMLSSPFWMLITSSLICQKQGELDVALWKSTLVCR